jgi:hypothetical protein
LKSFVVRIYRFKKKKPRMLVGVVEEVGVKGRKAFTNLDELWEIFTTVENNAKKLRRGEIPERRNERRIKKEIPFVFIFGKRNLDASTMNYSENGLGIKIFKKFALPVGDTVNLKIKDSAAKAEVMWVKKEIDPPVTMAGLKIVDGALNLKGVRKNTSFIMRGRSCDVVL